MSPHQVLNDTRHNDDELVPGDILLIKHADEANESDEFQLSPVPPNDPNSPLNWSTQRKFVNYTLVIAVSTAVFTALSTQVTFWQQMTVDMGLTYAQLNNAQSANLAGLAMGCVFFIPFAQKFGRRLPYVIGTAAMAAASWWSSRMTTLAELYLTNLLFGLAGATNETLVQMTVADLFFVHQRGTMNAFYLFAVMTGSFLTPMASGVQAAHEGWRWSYYALSISLTILFVVFIFAYEDTKWVPVIDSVPETRSTATSTQAEGDDLKDFNKHTPSTTLHHTISGGVAPSPPPLMTYSQRLRWLTPTSESLVKLFIFPLYVITLPHVLYTAIQYAAAVVWLVILSSVVSIVFSEPPYNFDTAGIGYMSLGPFVGNLIGSFYAGILSDWSIKMLAKRNHGYFEPEMRLYLLLLPAFTMGGGLIMFGITASKGMHWIYPSVGGALFAFGLGAIGDVSFTFVIDSYRPLTAEAFVGIAFLRNAISIGIPFAITPWMEAMGLANMFIVCGVVAFAIAMMFVPFVIWGRQMRRALAPRYNWLLEQQGMIVM